MQKKLQLTIRATGSALLLPILASSLLFAQSGPEYHRSAIMRGNLVKTVFGNWGVIGQPDIKGARGAWIYENNGYIGDVSPMVGAEVVTDEGTVFHSVVISPVSRPTLQAERSPENKDWSFEPVAGYFNEGEESVALFSDPDSWPAFWPDRMNDPEDPGWPGSWNGFRGKLTTASEECYFVMDDQNDSEFNNASNNIWGVAFKPDSTNSARNGLGLEVKVRGMQWPNFLAQDCIFWLYEITNTSTTDYNKVVFGMLVGTYLGVTSTRDYREYDDDYSFFDVERDLTYTGDFDDDASRNPLWTGDVGVVGYAFLESPGNPFDGIDNDGDADQNLLVPSTAPFFVETDFAPRTIQAGDKVVLIDRNYERQVVTVPGQTTSYTTRNARQPIVIEPGVTVLAEGNVITEDGEESINPNAYDGVDNDLDGLIDENFYLHYRQIRKDQDGNVLIDKLAPVRYKDYVNGLGLNDNLIDEKRNDGIDNDGDWNPEFDDIGADGLIGSNDRGEGDGVPTAGEPNFDATDVDESDQIGLTSFEYFTPAGEFSMADDEELWGRLSPGFFDVPASIVNNKPIQGEDGDFIYGSGYFPLPAGETRHFSLALVYGEGGGPQVDIVDLLKNRVTVQDIYNNDYNFPPPPDKPTLTAVPGDGKVTLYWDRKSENSFDPVLKEYDFEGYKIYKATDQNFNEVFKITDADGRPIYYQPLAQMDLDNDIDGYFRAGEEAFQDSRGASFNLGENTGLKHMFVDEDVENGRRYFYALVAYDRGDPSKDIFPQENDKRIDILPSGEVRTFQNTAAAIPNGPVLGYEPPEGSSLLFSEGRVIGTGRVYSKVVDETELTGHEYRVDFLDTSNDGIDNDGDWDVLTDDTGTDGIMDTNDPDGTERNGLPDPGEPNVDMNDPSEYFVPVTTSYSVRDLTGVIESFTAQDTIIVRLKNQHIAGETVVVEDGMGDTVDPSLYILDTVGGKIKGSRPGSLRYRDTYTIRYQYYPVFRSPNMENNPYKEETLDTDNFDGMRLSFDNHWDVRIDTLNSGWTDSERSYSFTFRIIDTNFGKDRLLGEPHPADYRFEFSDTVADTSLAMPESFIPAIPVNFRIYNVTDGRYLDFIYNNPEGNRKLSPYDEIVLLEPGENGEMIYTWDIYFTQRKDLIFDFHTGDTLKIALKKPFRTGDVFTFRSDRPSAKSYVKKDLEAIRVVPNPYIVATTHELPLPPAITSGRGPRMVSFIHLPQDSKVHLFTSRGEHVRTLDTITDINNGTLNWDLKTKENLDVAAGIYLYVIETKVGNKTGKLAIIK
ncbi:hypothetical protein JW948_17575 [bacterium]|nr:hypothetical protein [bacterium]